ncbi:MAG: hypothetical protein IKM39_04030, partial [Clostridia bacterium]|nr:hypothetical protein [Clostridia bacterium]
PQKRSDLVWVAKNNAIKVGKSNSDGSVSVYVNDIGMDVILATKGLRHGLRRMQDVQDNANFLVTLKAGEILKNSIRINELTPSKADVNNSYILIGMAKTKDGNFYIVESVVNRYKNELVSMDVLYSINAKKELAANNSPRLTAKPLSVTSSTISISDLLQYVNKFFPDVLPEDVLRHFGHNSRPDGELGKHVLFQSRDYGTIGDVDVSAELAKDNAKLKKDNEYLRKLVGLTGGQYYTKTSLGAATSYVMKEAGVSRGKERVQGMLQELYRYIAKGEEVTWDEIMRRSRNIAIQMQDMKPKKETVDPYLEEIRKEIQSRRISLTYTQRQEAEHLYGSVQNFRRQNMGRFTVANDGVPLDVAWAELSHLYPGTFDPDINEGDMVSQLVEIYESTKSTIPEYFDVEEEIRSLSCGV